MMEAGTTITEPHTKGAGTMKCTTKFVGLDVSKATISVAVSDRESAPPRYYGSIPNTSESVRKLVKRLGQPEDLLMCYEAGPTGYGLYRHLCELGVPCVVVAPTLIPTKPGDQVKTDRRDALRLSQLLRAGELTAVWVPSEDDEALRDLVRAREFAKRDLRRARQRVSSFLLRHSVDGPQGMRRWSKMFMRWLDTLSFDRRSSQIAFQEYIQTVRDMEARLERLESEIHSWATEGPQAPVIQALQALKGVREITAVTVTAEIGQFSRFDRAEQIMGYSGLVPREHSSGSSTWRGGITKSGNSHVRFVLGESSWAYRHQPATKAPLRARQKGLDPEVIRIAMKAQQRLHRTYWRLLNRGKSPSVAATAVARELLGFMWAIACHVEATMQQESAA